MKTPFSLALGAVLCLILSSCNVTSDNPLSSPDTAQADQRLIGDWYSEKDQETFRFTATKSPWMHVVITPQQTETGNRPRMIDLKPEEYDFFPTVIGKNTFLNVVTIGKDEQGHPTKTYIFARYTISGNHVLQMWMLSQDAAASAVRDGKLKGIVHQDKNAMLVGQPPHPDVDVTLQDTTANLVKFIQSTDVDAFFSDKGAPLTRVKSTGR